MVFIQKRKNSIKKWFIFVLILIITFLFLLNHPYQILGNLYLFKNPILNDKYTYDIWLSYKKLGTLNITDTWKIENEFVYGVMSYTIKEKNDAEKYFLFNCKNNEIVIMEEWQPFILYMKSKGLYDTDFIMEGENPVNLKYNKRLFSPVCPK